MRFLSLFSGIEAASLAWGPLGWEAVAFSEIDPFCCALLAHRFPGVLNLGDVTKITQDQVEALGPIDVVVGGFPCQDVSIAGAGKGLEDEHGTKTRSGLFHDAMRVVRWARPRWTVIENVPGLFTSPRKRGKHLAGRDFADVVGALAGCELDVPDGGWRNAGMAAGPDGLVEWAVLDAQFFGVAQRRARLFLVRDSGSWSDRPPVLLEPESLRGDAAPRREAGAAVTGTLAVGGGGKRAGGGPAGRSNATDEVVLCEGTARALTARSQRLDGPVETFVTAPLLSLSRSGGPRPVDVEGGSPVVVFQKSRRAQDAQDAQDDETWKPAEVANTLNRFDVGERDTHVVAFSLVPEGGQGADLRASRVEVSGAVTAKNENCNGYDRGIRIVDADSFDIRRLTPLEWERLQGMPDGWTSIPYRGKPASDGPRYRAIGNSFAVPAARWIAERIAAAVGYAKMVNPAETE